LSTGFILHAIAARPNAKLYLSYNNTHLSLRKYFEYDISLLRFRDRCVCFVRNFRVCGILLILLLLSGAHFATEGCAGDNRSVGGFVPRQNGAMDKSVSDGNCWPPERWTGLSLVVAYRAPSIGTTFSE